MIPNVAHCNPAPHVRCCYVKNKFFADQLTYYLKEWFFGCELDYPCFRVVDINDIMGP